MICLRPARFVVLVLSFTYTVLLYGIYVPDWEYQISGPGSREKSFSVSAVLLYLLYLVIGSAYNSLSADIQAKFEFVR